jgi:hypothetical protein
MDELNFYDRMSSGALFVVYILFSILASVSGLTIPIIRFLREQISKMSFPVIAVTELGFCVNIKSGSTSQDILAGNFTVSPVF